MSKKQTVKNPSVQVKDWPQFIKNYNRYGEKRRQAGLQELGSMLDHIDSVAVMPDPEKTPGGPTIVVVRGNNGEIIVYIFYGPFVKKVVVDLLGPKVKEQFSKTVRGATKIERASVGGIQSLVVISKDSKIVVQAIPVK